MSRIVSLPPSLIKLSVGTEASWTNTTIKIPDGVVCYASDIFQSKIGDGNTLYKDLPYAFNAVPKNIIDIINENTFITSDEDNHIPTSFFPKDVFNIHTVVENIAARDALSLDTIKNSQMIFVIDATDDPSVNTGMAFYTAKFTDDITYTWIKTGEQESIDLDLSQYLKIVDTTIDDIADSDVYKHTTQEELDAVASALQASDDYTVDLMDFNYWYSPIDEALLTYITVENGTVVDKIENTVTIPSIPISTDPSDNSLVMEFSAHTISYANNFMSGIADGDFTIEFVLKANSMAGYGNLFKYNTPSGVGIAVRFGDSGFHHTLQLLIGVISSGSSVVITKVNKTTAATYHKYAFVRKDKQLTFYIDDVLSQIGYYSGGGFADSLPNTVAIPANAASGFPRIGFDPTGYINANIKNFKIYSAAVIPEQYRE